MSAPSADTWFRNTWTLGDRTGSPALRSGGLAPRVIRRRTLKLGDYCLHCEGSRRCCLPKTRRIRSGCPAPANPTPYVKDGIQRIRRSRPPEAVNPGKTGTKAAAHYRHVPPGERWTSACGSMPQDGRGRSATSTRSRALAPEGKPTNSMRRDPASFDRGRGNVMRQALAGMLWGKQFYFFDVDRWLEERGCDPSSSPAARTAPRNGSGSTCSTPTDLHAGQVGISVVCGLGPRFHAIALALVDFDFAQGAARA